MNAKEQFGHWATVRQGLVRALGTLTEFRATQQRVLDVVGRMPERVLTDPGALLWLDEAHRDPWRPIPIDSYEHCFEHIKLIRAWMEREG